MKLINYYINIYIYESDYIFDTINSNILSV